MTTPEAPVEPVDLTVLGETLLTEARAAGTRPVARPVHTGDLLRQVLFALAGGAEMSEHASPPEATVQVLTGRISLRGHGRDWELTTGDLLPIPPERHSVVAIEDSVFLLTVRRDPAPADSTDRGPRP